MVGRLAFPLFAYGICGGRGDDPPPAAVYRPRGRAGARQPAALRRGARAYKRGDVRRSLRAASPARALHLLYGELGKTEHPACAAVGASSAVVPARKAICARAFDLCALRALLRRSGLRRERHRPDGDLLPLSGTPGAVLRRLDGGSLMLSSGQRMARLPLFGARFGMRIFATPAVMLASLPIRRKTRTPKWLSYGFYPAHLLACSRWKNFFEKEVDRRRRIRYYHSFKSCG